MRIVFKAPGLDDVEASVEVDSPIEEVIVQWLPVNQNNVLVSYWSEYVQVIRIRKLKEWKKKYKISSLCGYYNRKETKIARIFLPPVGGQYLPQVRELCQYLFGGTYEDRYE